jgi:hypothetical protein
MTRPLWVPIFAMSSKSERPQVIFLPLRKDLDSAQQ